MSRGPQDGFADEPREPRRRPLRRNDDYYDDAPPRRRPATGGGSTSKVLLIIGGIALVGFCCVSLICGGGGFFWFQRGQESQGRLTNLKKIGLAFHDYNDTHGKFPTAKPLKRQELGQANSNLSWRVHLLPFLGQHELYSRFKLGEPWDSPHNMSLLREMPEIYRKKGDPVGTTTMHYRVFVGPLTAWSSDTNQPRFSDFQDGTSNTLLVVEATDAAPWTKPDELQFSPKGPLPSLGLPGETRVACVLGDGSVMYFRKSASPESLRKAITASGGEILDVRGELR